MTLLPAPENQAADLFDLALGIETQPTSLDDYLSAKVGEGFWSSLTGQFKAEFATSNKAADMEQFGEWRRAAMRGEQPAYNEPVLTEDDWKASPWYRDRLSWDQRMTATRAQALADVYDENAYRRWKIEQSPSGLRSVPGFVAQMVGGAPDPVNYVPFMGPASKAAMAARIARVLGPTATKIAAPAAAHGAEAMIGAAMVEPVVIPSMRGFGDDVGFADAAMDIGFAGLLGASFGGVGGAWRAFRERGTGHSVPVQADAAAVLSDAVSDLVAGRAVQVEQAALLRARNQIRSEVEALRASPEMQPGPAAEVLATLTPETMKDFVVDVRRGAAFREDGKLGTPARGGEGLIKVEIKHGDVTDAEVLALPVALREQEGVLYSSAGKTDVWEWRRHVDGAEVFYRLKSRATAKDAGKMYLVTIYKETDPAKFKGETPYRNEKPAAADPLGSTGRFQSSDTTQAFSVQSPGDRMQPATASVADPRPDVAITVKGREVPVEYQVVEAGDLLTSHTLDMAHDPRFPAELQPRDRTRVASGEQVARIAADIRPELLGRTAAAGDGAPIIGPAGDGHAGVVESGNGRVLALRRAYAEGGSSAIRYREWIKRQGFDVETMREPVLVRRRVGEMSEADRIAFTREANERPVLALSATERAIADAHLIDGGMMELHQGGALTSGDNRAFVRTFLDRIAPEDRAALVDRDGRLSAEGVRRMQNALLAKAYDDANLVAVLAEDVDPDIKTIGRVLTDIAPDWVRLRSAVAEGVVSRDMDQTRALMRAVDLIRNARDKGEKVRDLAAQMDLFDPMAPEVQAFLKLFYGEDLKRAVGRDKLAVALGRYVADAQMNVRVGLFPPRPVGDVLEAARGLRPKGTDFTVAPEIRAAEDARAEIPATGDSVEALAREAGIDPHTGDFDELMTLRQMEAEGRLHPDETNAVRQAEDLMRRAEDYPRAYEAAALCMARTA